MIARRIGPRAALDGQTGGCPAPTEQFASLYPKHRRRYVPRVAKPHRVGAALRLARVP